MHNKIKVWEGKKNTIFWIEIKHSTFIILYQIKTKLNYFFVEPAFAGLLALFMEMIDYIYIYIYK